jgi:hypothetical protein
MCIDVHVFISMNNADTTPSIYEQIRGKALRLTRWVRGFKDSECKVGCY